MKFAALSHPIFERSILDYHKTDDVNAPIRNPYPLKSIEYYLYLKNWIDTVQWHLEDVIRDPNIDPAEALKIKRRIDRSNQDRTDLVELIDSYFLDKYKAVEILPEATINTESPAWACSSLSRYSVSARFKLFPSLLFNVSSRRGAVSSFGSASKKSMASLLAKAKSLQSRTRSATRKSVTPCCRIPQTSPGPRCFRSASARSNPLEVQSIARSRAHV